MHASNFIDFPYTSVPSSFFTSPTTLSPQQSQPSIALLLRRGLDYVRDFLYVIGGEHHDLLVFWEVVVENSVQQAFPVKLW